jgi:hypothetical protein
MKPFTLPTTASGPQLLEPLNLCLYGRPGTWKTPICMSLPDSIHIDCEQGGIYYAGRSVNVVKLAEEQGAPLHEIYAEVCRQARALKPKFIIHDTIGEIADWADARALEKFRASPMGKDFDQPSILDLPGVKGSAGFGKLWEAFQELLSMGMGAFHRAIYIGHPRDKIAYAVGTDPNVKSDSIVSSEDLDLTGKMRRMFTAKMAAIGYMEKDWDGKRMNVFFQARDSFSRTRCPHLEGAKLWFSNPCTLAEWARIYPQTLYEHLTPEDKEALAPLLSRYGGAPAAMTSAPAAKRSAK